MTQVTCAADELALLERLRDVPAGSGRDALLALISDLLEFARDPRCAEAQADGVPCARVDGACEECLHATGILKALRPLFRTTLSRKTR
jgi:hypothetical protein